MTIPPVARPLGDALMPQGGSDRTVKATVPLVVSIDKPAFPATTRVHYFWFFGYVAKLPAAMSP